MNKFILISYTPLPLPPSSNSVSLLFRYYYYSIFCLVAKKLVLKFKISPLFLFSNFERKFCFVFVLNTEFVKRNSEDT